MRTRAKAQRTGWWALVGGTVVGLALTLALKREYAGMDMLLLAWVAYAPVGAVVARRRPENPMGWIFLLVGLLASFAGVSYALVHVVMQSGPPVPWWGVLAAIYANSFWFPLLMLATTFTFLLYPSGLLSPRWRPVLWLAVACVPVAVTVSALSPVIWFGDIGEANAFSIQNPISPMFPAVLEDERVYSGGSVISELTMIAAAVSALIRAWRSRGIERLQMRMFGSAILFFLILLIPAWWLETSGPPFLRWVVLAVGFACIPLACGVAIMRYRLYDIDRIIGRTTAYGLVTSVLLAVYAVVVTAVTALLPGSGDAAVAAATLAAAAAFRPVLGSARRIVDRRFNREAFNAGRTLEQFAVRLRGQVDGDEVVEDLLAVLDRTVQPRAAGVWLREPS